MNVRLTLQIPLKVELLNLAIHDVCVPPPAIGKAGGVDDVIIGDATMVVTLGS